MLHQYFYGQSLFSTSNEFSRKCDFLLLLKFYEIEKLSKHFNGVISIRNYYHNSRRILYYEHSYLLEQRTTEFWYFFQIEFNH